MTLTYVPIYLPIHRESRSYEKPGSRFENERGGYGVFSSISPTPHYPSVKHPMYLRDTLGYECKYIIIVQVIFLIFHLFFINLFHEDAFEKNSLLNFPF